LSIGLVHIYVLSLRDFVSISWPYDANDVDLHLGIKPSNA